MKLLITDFQLPIFLSVTRVIKIGNRQSAIGN